MPVPFSRTYPSSTGLSTSYSYFGNTSTDGNPGDGDQRLQTIQNFKSGSTNISRFDYTYNPVGTIATWTQTADAGTAVVNTLAYDNADQLASATQSGGGSAYNDYHYDLAGNRLTETTASGTTAGKFNNLNQLTALVGGPSSTTVSGHASAALSSATVNSVTATISNSTNFSASVPLPNGTNIVSVVATPTTGSTLTQPVQLVASGTPPTGPTYDANGNCTTDENGNTYTWDALNRVVSIAYHSGTYSGTHTEFAYDGLSRRVSIIEKSGTTYGSGTASSTKLYIWVGSEIAEERASNGTSVTKCFFPQGEQQSGTDYYYTRDHLGSVREMLNSSGTIVARYSYDPYGRTTLVSGTILATKQYAGCYIHPTSGLYLTKYRAYDPNTGRWLSRDPIAESGGLNLYGYVHDNPLNSVDPDGKQALPPPERPPLEKQCPCAALQDIVNKLRQNVQQDQQMFDQWQNQLDADNLAVFYSQQGLSGDEADEQIASHIDETALDALDEDLGQSFGVASTGSDIVHMWHNLDRVDHFRMQSDFDREMIDYWREILSEDKAALRQARKDLLACLRNNPH